MTSEPVSTQLAQPRTWELLEQIKIVFEKWREGDFVTDEECERLGAKVDQLADERFETELAALLYCQGGHMVIDDHCMKPEHRFCLKCHAPMPNEQVTA